MKHSASDPLDLVGTIVDDRYRVGAVARLAILASTILATVVTASACGSDGSAESATVQFLNLRVEDIGSTSAIVRFDTSRPTTCEVEYGSQPGALDQRATDPSMVDEAFSTAHQVPLTGLVPASTYYYRARATDASGNTFFSDPFTFSTLPQDTSSANVALLSAGTTVVAVSSNFGGGGNDSAWGANHAIDGQIATEWATNGDGDEAFLQLDLGRERLLRRISFQSRKMADGSSIMQALRITLDDSTELGPYDAPDPDELYTFELEAPMAARQVKLEAVKTTGGNTGVRELQLFE